ncbi:MAG: PQQ-dependent sugar dehydrogenase [Anaerolineae bacterium]|nr:PQQ-dependent sugar dehydrogenase [Anaerolineae bacterium]MDW8172194.1 PQQ-dependent sugar dehydrogenase [Anaerolineae bacterium]
MRVVAVLSLLACLSSSALAQQLIPAPLRLVVEQYAPANFPVGMVFDQEGALYYNEKTTGRVRRIAPDGRTDPQPIATFTTSALQERGLLGLTLSPNFAESRVMYLVYTKEGTARSYPANTLVRLHLGEDGRAARVDELLSLPITNGYLMHNGGNVHFGPDGALYVSFGDFGEAAKAQDLEALQGKILRYRVEDEGPLLIPDDNPFPGSPVYAYGLRNPFDFTFDPFNGNLFAAEVGPSCDDELNLILPGWNYGWREGYECVGTGYIPGLRLYAPPLLSFTPVEAPTGILIYDGEMFPEWQGNLLWCNWNFGDLRRAVLDETRTRVLEVHKIDLGQTQCRIDLVQAPDGALLFGTVGSFGGAIMRLSRGS